MTENLTEQATEDENEWGAGGGGGPWLPDWGKG